MAKLEKIASPFDRVSETLDGKVGKVGLLTQAACEMVTMSNYVCVEKHCL
jgi:hypothetical protein